MHKRNRGTSVRTKINHIEPHSRISILHVHLRSLAAIVGCKTVKQQRISGSKEAAAHIIPVG